ncbi:MAG TPA: decarboxylating 6-phosphogluconate dehydrogenase [Longilinea sp.]|nr:decarboxylating 6-phosphogluconate dehydrogenase [Longilinea sp.]
MDIAMIGLGKMGANMTRRLMKGGHHLVVFDVNPAAVHALETEGATGAYSWQEVAASLPAPRLAWVMVPAGQATDDTIEALMEVFSAGDVIIDGGNSNYKDDARHATLLSKKGIHFVDVGTSGGVWGLENGYSLMIGGEEDVVERLRPIFETLAPASDKGWGRVGPAGAGHFVKMVHNGIEYGMMQAYAEGFEILKNKKEFGLDLEQVTHIWQCGSVVRSWLLDLTADVFAKGQDLKDIESWVPDSGEGRWTVAEAIDLDVPAPVITLSLMMRLVSRQDESYAAKLLAAMRNEFGGHEVKHKE